MKDINSKRLSGALDRVLYAENSKQKIDALALILNYDKEQLIKDIKSLYQFVNGYES